MRGTAKRYLLSSMGNFERPRIRNSTKPRDSASERAANLPPAAPEAQTDLECAVSGR
jgi:hypothetical protein